MCTADQVSLKYNYSQYPEEQLAGSTPTFTKPSPLERSQDECTMSHISVKIFSCSNWFTRINLCTTCLEASFHANFHSWSCCLAAHFANNYRKSRDPWSANQFIRKKKRRVFQKKIARSVTMSTPGNRWFSDGLWQWLVHCPNVCQTQYSYNPQTTHVLDPHLVPTRTKQTIVKVKVK